MFKMDYRREGMIERAAARVRTTSLERSRANKVYKQHLKEMKNPNELEGDQVFDRLREELEIAKANYNVARQTFEAIKTAPPL